MAEEKLEKEVIDAFHNGHKAGYTAGYARGWNAALKEAMREVDTVIDDLKKMDVTDGNE